MNQLLKKTFCIDFLFVLIFYYFYIIMVASELTENKI